MTLLDVMIFFYSEMNSPVFWLMYFFYLQLLQDSYAQVGSQLTSVVSHSFCTYIRLNYFKKFIQNLTW